MSSSARIELTNNGPQYILQYFPMADKTDVQSQIESYQSLKNMILDAPCNNQHYKLQIKVKRNNLGKGEIHYHLAIGLMNRVFPNGPGDRGSIPRRIIQKTQKWYLMALYLTLSIIR